MSSGVFLSKDNANERYESLLSDCRVQLIFSKEDAKRRQSQIKPSQLQAQMQYFPFFLPTINFLH